jgi:nitrite reductase/ring-hydroxylating ferredoxin subunit
MSELERILVPPGKKGHVSVAHLSRYWYVACLSSELGSRPIARTVLGTPMALFRIDGRAAALLDRCAHRNLPLSQGRVTSDGFLTCRYHGWQYDGSGLCRLVPGLLDRTSDRERRVLSFPVREQQGLVWVYASADAEPDREPFALPLTSEPGYATVLRRVEAHATLHAVLENALDVPHTGFLHRGLFRGGGKHSITAVVRRSADRVETEYLGEPRPSGVAARLLSPRGGPVQHWDRFILPSVAQVEYRLGDDAHFLVTSACTPVTDFRTRLFAVVSFRTRIPARLVKPVLEPIALRIFGQDAAILRAQSRNIRRFGGEQFMSTELDLMGPHIWRLLRHAERGEVPPSQKIDEQRVTFMA